MIPEERDIDDDFDDDDEYLDEEEDDYRYPDETSPE